MLKQGWIYPQQPLQDPSPPHPMPQLAKRALEKLMHEINALSGANVRFQGFPLVVGTSTNREWHGTLIHPIDSYSCSVINATFVDQMGSAADVFDVQYDWVRKTAREGLFHGSLGRLAEKVSVSVPTGLPSRSQSAAGCCI
jgi:hypothetical protein